MKINPRVQKPVQRQPSDGPRLTLESLWMKKSLTPAYRDQRRSGQCTKKFRITSSTIKREMAAAAQHGSLSRMK
jgi:hypothetical protein